MAKRTYTLKETKAKAAKYCAYQERTQQQVRDKLYDWGLYSDEVEEVLSELIAENFINEERFAKVYASGHFRLKKWGRLKIKMGLEQKRISPYCIKVGLKEINEEAYEAMIAELLEKKWRSLKDSNEYVRKQKAVRYVMQKGFEPDLIWAAVDTLNLN